MVYPTTHIFNKVLDGKVSKQLP